MSIVLKLRPLTDDERIMVAPAGRVVICPDAMRFERVKSSPGSQPVRVVSGARYPPAERVTQEAD